MNNLEEYDNPISYDEENNHYLGELPLLMKWADKKKGTIVDLACGTGRLTIPLATAGYNIIGVDIHSGMLAHAKRKAEELGLEIEWVEQDCTELDVPFKSSLIYMVGNSFQHFHTNLAQNQVLSSVWRQLEDGGIFIFGIRFPNAEELLQPPVEEYWKTYVDRSQMKEIDVYTISEYDALQQIQHYTTIRRTKNSDEESRTHISLRYTYPQEMERLLESNLFEVVGAYGDWNSTPIQSNSHEMVYVCRKKGM